jgi:hypothetical protein
VLVAPVRRARARRGSRCAQHGATDGVRSGASEEGEHGGMILRGLLRVKGGPNRRGGLSRHQGGAATQHAAPRWTDPGLVRQRRSTARSLCSAKPDPPQLDRGSGGRAGGRRLEGWSRTWSPAARRPTSAQGGLRAASCHAITPLWTTPGSPSRAARRSSCPRTAGQSYVSTSTPGTRARSASGAARAVPGRPGGRRCIARRWCQGSAARSHPQLGQTEPPQPRPGQGPPVAVAS